MIEASPRQDKSDRRHLLAFAAAQAMRQSGNDPLLTIVPLFFPIADDFSGQQFQPDIVRSELDKRYGLDVSSDVVTHWIPELVREGALKRVDVHESSDTYFWQSTGSLKNSRTANFDMLFEDIVQKFIIFAKTTNDLFFVGFDENKAIEIFYDLLVLDSITVKGMCDNSASSSEEKYIFARFVDAIKFNNPELLEFLATVRASAILADILFHLHVPKVKDHELRGLNIYLDGPLAMDAIGVSGRQTKKYMDRLISLTKQAGAMLFLPDHYVPEIRDNLYQVINALPSERRGPTAKAILAGDVDVPYLKFVRENVENLLDQQGIRVDSSFRRHVDQSTVTRDQCEVLFSKLNTSYNNLHALERDVDTYRGMLKRRGVKREYSLTKVGSLFVTRNALLSGVVNAHVREEHGYSGRDFPIFLTSSKYSAILCAMYGFEKSRDIPVQELLSSTSRSLEFRPELFGRIQQYLDEKDVEDREALLAMLRSQDFSTLALDAAIGHERNLNDQNTADLIQTLKDRLKHEAQLELAADKRISARRVRDTERKAHVAMRNLRRDMFARQRKRMARLVKKYREYSRGERCVQTMVNYSAVSLSLAFAGLSFWVSGVFEIPASVSGVVAGLVAIATGVPSPALNWLKHRAYLLGERNYRKSLLEVADYLEIPLPKERPLSVADLIFSLSNYRLLRHQEAEESAARTQSELLLQGSAE